MRARVLLAFAALWAAATPARAQAPDSACTYLACALRVEPRGPGTAVARGAQGEVVGRVGLLGLRPELSRLVRSDSDSATAYALAFERLAPRGAARALLGAVLTAAPGLTGDEWSDGANAAVSLGGAGVTLYAVTLLGRAQRALSRSLWWHNAALAR